MDARISHFLRECLGYGAENATEITTAIAAIMNQSPIAYPRASRAFCNALAQEGCARMPQDVREKLTYLIGQLPVFKNGGVKS